MKLKTLLLSMAALSLATVPAFATKVDCSTISTLADALATNTNSDAGCVSANLTFTNFSFLFQSGTSSGTGTNPQTPAANEIGLSIGNDGFGDYSVITDFSNSSPFFAVTANDTMQVELQYFVTETDPNSTITDIGWATQQAIRSQAPAAATAVGTFVKKECDSSAYGDTGLPNPAPLETCSTSESTVGGAVYNNATTENGGTGSCGADDADPTCVLNQSISDGDKAVSLSSVGIYDKATLNGGSQDNPAGLYQAAVGNFENDFTEVTVTPLGGAPEPGTFVLLGGALVGLGALRRRKKTA
jgi:hypothetical protein